MTTVDTVNPVDGKPLASYAAMSATQVGSTLDTGALAAQSWGRVPVADRVLALVRLAAHLREERELYAVLINREMGKPLPEARAELEKSAVTADHYATHAQVMLADRPVPITAPEGL